MHIFCLDYTVSASKSYPLRVQNKLTTSKTVWSIIEARNLTRRKKEPAPLHLKDEVRTDSEEKRTELRPGWCVPPAGAQCLLKTD
ncbi:hypothetical protein, partial [Mitsuokella jalaludinii]|uniref:hypothetical protein n=1 Tax=Mitsuokella jalaludinii TaxID=187979 RepID=UPI0030797556